MLIDPISPVCPQEEYRKARLIALILLIILVALVIRTVVASRSSLGWLVLILTTCILAYALARTRFYKIAIWVTIIGLCLPSYFRLFEGTPSHDPNSLTSHLSWLILPVVLGSLLLPAVGMAGLIMVNIIFISLLPLLLPGLPLRNLLSPLGFFGTTSVIVLVVLHLREIFERERQTALLGREKRLNEVTRAIGSSLDLPGVLENVTRLAAELVGADGGALALVSFEGEEIVGVHDYNLPQDVDGIVLPRGTGLTWEIIETRRSVLLDDYGSHPKALKALKEVGTRAFIGVPIIVGDVCLGFLSVLSRNPTKRFDERDLELVEAVARQAGVAIQNGRLYAALQNELAERRRAEHALRESESLYRRAISAAGAVPYYQDYATKSYPFVGEGIQYMTGFSTEEMSPELFFSLVQETIPMGEAAELGMEKAIEYARSGKISNWNCDFLIRNRNGEMRWINDSSIEIMGQDGISTGSIGILQDITERKLAEEHIRQLNVELEERVRQRTAELVVANKELEAFAYSVSHDMRAPLRAVSGYSSLLLMDFQDELGADGQHYLNSIRQATQNMERLIDELLKLSRVTRAEMNRAQVDLSELSANIFAHLQGQNTDRHVEVKIEPGLQALGDPNLLRIALENLLGNAWKFTRDAPDTCIEVGAIQEADRVIYFTRDNGAGFDPRYTERLFQPFQRLHRPDEFEGSGIGLATVQRIIRRHGGQIWAEGEVGKGACFYFTLECPPRMKDETI